MTLRSGTAVRWAIVGAACALAALAAGCGGEAATDGESASRTVVEPAAEPAVEMAAIEEVAAEPEVAAPEPPPAEPRAADDPAPRSEAPRRPVVVLDPGHGGTDVGAMAHGVTEKHSNLAMALRIKALLEAAGIDVVLTRESDERLAEAPLETELPRFARFAANRADLQARVDLANGAEADLLVAIHSNGHPEGNVRGVEAWYDPTRPFADENLRIAELLIAHVITELGAFGYAAFDRGALDDTCWRSFEGNCFALFMLGPPRVMQREWLEDFGIDPAVLGFAPDQETLVTRATQMPGALVELLFISNEADATVLHSDAGQEALARGVAGAVLAYFNIEPTGGEPD